MRDARKLDETRMPPVARVLARDTYLTLRFYDAIIKSAVLRASRAHDLRATLNERDLLQDVQRFLRSNAEPELPEFLAELGLAIAQGKLPRPSVVSEEGCVLYGGAAGVRGSASSRAVYARAGDAEGQ